jgi:CBS domain-containing protein
MGRLRLPEEEDSTMSEAAKDPIGTLMAPAVATILPTATLRQAAESMMADGVGLLVVADANGPTAVLSERDIVAAVTEDLDLEVERVRDHGSDEIVSIADDASIADAALAMAEAQIRHLAVTRDGAVVGVVSVRDVLRSLVS